jgi:hypothetical protein
MSHIQETQGRGRGSRSAHPPTSGPAAGLSLGTGAGLEVGRFRLDLRYDHLFNFVSASPNANSFSALVGGSF